MRSAPRFSTTQQRARAARGTFEAALDCAGWRFTRGASLWIDVLVTIEEHARA